MVKYELILIDHVGAVKQVKEKTGADFVLHEAHDPEITIGMERKGSFVRQ